MEIERSECEVLRVIDILAVASDGLILGVVLPTFTLGMEGGAPVWSFKL